MMSLLENVAPPRGGVAALHRRVERRRHRNQAIAGVALLAVGIGLATLLVKPGPHDSELASGPLARVLSGREAALVMRDGTALEAPSAARDVRIYWVAVSAES